MEKHAVARPILGLACAVVLVTTPLLSAAEEWSLDLGDPPLMCKVVNDTRGLASTDSALYGIDLNTGTIDWTIEDWFCRSPDLIGIIPDTPLALCLKTIETEKKDSMSGALERGFKNELCVLDFEQGTILWRLDGRVYYSCLGYSLLPRGDGLLICVRDEDKAIWMLSVDLLSGRVNWENRDFFGDHKPKTFYSKISDRMIDGNQPPAFVSESTMITLYAKNHLQKWDLETGQMIWESELDTESVPLIAEGITPIMLDPDRSVAWVPCKNRLKAVNVADGSVKWDSEKVKLPGLIRQVIPLEKELVVVGGSNLEGKDGNPFITLLDRATGQRIWKNDFKKLKILKTSPALLQNDHVLIYSDKKMYEVALADGSYLEVAKDLEFEGGEVPEALIVRNGNFLLLSAQNMMMLDTSYGVIYHSYHKKPGTAFLLKALSFTGQLALNTISAMAFSVPIYSAGGTTWVVFPMLYFGLPKYGNSVDAKDHMFVLCKVEEAVGGERQEGWGVVKVDKNTGQIAGETIIGEKNPEFDIAPAGDAIMFIDQDDSLVFKPM